jgi:hypothetical protein
MSGSRLRGGEVIAGVSGVALLVFMFFGWYETQTFCALDLTGPGTSCVGRSVDAWEAFSVIDLFLALTVISGIGVAIVTAANAQTDVPITWEAGTALVSFLTSLLVIYRLLDPPSGLERKPGLYLGLLACLGVLAGAWLAMRDDRTGAPPL